MLPVGLLEVSLRVAGYGFDTSFLLEKMVNGQRVFVDNPRFALRFFPSRLARTSAPLLISADKPVDTLRVVVLGESAAYGDPAPAYGLPRVLEVLLQEHFPTRRFEVINAAMTAINSHAIREIAHDVRRLNPDFVIVYAGNNEVVGPFGPGTILGGAGRPLWLIRAGLWLRTFRTGQCLDAWASSLSSGGAGKKSDAEWGGMELFLSQKIDENDPRLASVRPIFEKNLAAIADLFPAGVNGPRVCLVTPVVNLKDCGPLGETNAATSASVAFLMGRTQWTNREPIRALASFQAARAADPLRFRADVELADIVRSVGRAASVPVVDAEAEFARASPDGIAGAEYFWEHVHFNEAGNYLLARFVADSIASRLPTDVTANARPNWLNAVEVAQALALTDWNRLQIAESMRARLARPPFSTQINSVERGAALTNQLARLKPARAITAFEIHAAIYRTALARRTNDWQLHQQFAELLSGFGDADGAMTEWREVLTRIPHHLIAHYQLGRLLAVKVGTAVEAEVQLRAAVELREDFVEAWEQLGEALSQQRRFLAADVAFARAIELRPSFTDARANRALAQQLAGQTNAALQNLRAAVADDPNHPLALGRLASLLAVTGEPTEAAEIWERIVRNRPTGVAHIQAARAWEAATNLSRAGPHWVAAVAANPAQPEARMGLALALAKTGHSEQAIGELRELIQRTPDASSAHLNLGIILLSQKKTAEALTEFERTQELEPNSPKVRDYVQSVRGLLQQELRRTEGGK